MADERTKALDQVAEHFEARAAELDEFYRRFGERARYDSATLYAKADGFREAAVYARTVAANGRETRVRQPRQPRAAKTPAKAGPSTPKAPAAAAEVTEPKPWETASS
jgi:hypothetical protein